MAGLYGLADDVGGHGARTFDTGRSHAFVSECHSDFHHRIPLLCPLDIQPFIRVRSNFVSELRHVRIGVGSWKRASAPV